MNDTVTNTYALAKQAAAYVFSTSPFLRNRMAIKLALDGKADRDSMLTLQFEDPTERSNRCTVAAGHVYDQPAGTRFDAAGVEHQCCSVTFAVSWDDHRPMVPARALDRALFYAAVSRTVLEAQRAVDALGPTWCPIGAVRDEVSL